MTKKNTDTSSSSKMSKWKKENDYRSCSPTFKCIKHYKMKWHIFSSICLNVQHTLRMRRAYISKQSTQKTRIQNEIEIKTKIEMKKNNNTILSNFLLQQFLANRLQNWVWQFLFCVHSNWQLSMMVMVVMSFFYCCCHHHGVLVDFGFIIYFCNSFSFRSILASKTFIFTRNKQTQQKPNTNSNSTIDILLAPQCVNKNAQYAINLCTSSVAVTHIQV